MRIGLLPAALLVVFAIASSLHSRPNAHAENGKTLGHHEIKPSQLPPPNATSSSTNPPRVVPKPANAKLSLPPGFEISTWAEGGLEYPRWLALAPNGDVYVAGMDEGGGGTSNRQNYIFRSTDGGATWTYSTTGPSFPPVGDTSCGYFYAVAPIWRHMGWGQPGVGPGGVVHYVYAGRGAGPDRGRVAGIHILHVEGCIIRAPCVLEQHGQVSL